MTSSSDSNRSHDKGGVARLRGLPSIDQLLDDGAELVRRHGRTPATAALRDAVGAARDAVRAGAALPSRDELVAAAWRLADARRPPALRRVINATGVVVHTNLGRAPLPGVATDAMASATGYCDLEYDIESGGRGSRTARLEPLLCEATGAEAAYVVNNAAAALVLALAALAAGRGVVVSRGELIEIGGSFRLPDIMAASGARLVEVGTTNRTRASDFYGGDDVAAMLTLHPSNYRIVGFTERPSVTALAAVAADRSIPLIYDTGSGLLSEVGGAIADEPTVGGALRDGADLVLCSADKLLGGPQAGLLFGRADVVAACRRHPLARALRVDKLRVAALQATLELHLADRRQDIPVWRMLHLDAAQLRQRSKQVAAMLTAQGLTADVVQGAGVPGGGSAPDATLDGPVLRIDADDTNDLSTRLRHGDPPVVARIAEDALVLDLRTVDPDDDALVAQLVVAASRHHS